MKNIDTVSLLSSVLDMILKMTETVYTALDTRAGDSKRSDFYKDNTSLVRDDLYMSAAIIDNDIIAIFTSFMAACATSQTCKIQLGANGELSLSAEKLNQNNIKSVEVKTPTPQIKEAAAILSMVGDGVELANIVTQTGLSVKTIYDNAVARGLKEDYPPEEKS